MGQALVQAKRVTGHGGVVSTKAFAEHVVVLRDQPRLGVAAGKQHPAIEAMTGGEVDQPLGGALRRPGPATRHSAQDVSGSILRSDGRG